MRAVKPAAALKPKSLVSLVATAETTRAPAVAVVIAGAVNVALGFDEPVVSATSNGVVVSMPRHTAICPDMPADDPTQPAGNVSAGFASPPASTR